MKNFFFRLFFVISLFVTGISSGAQQPQVPVTAGGSSTLPESGLNNQLPSLFDFVSAVNQNPQGILAGVYVPGLFADPIVQQPANNAGYVSTQPEAITQFRMASKYNSIGLLAHNTAAGALFQNFSINQVVYLVKSTGEISAYRITEIQRYQALSPNSPYSNFIDLDRQGLTISAQTLFMNTYGRGGGTLVFQTCIAADGQPSWGRLFIIATPMENLPAQQIFLRTVKFSRHFGTNAIL